MNKLNKNLIHRKVNETKESHKTCHFHDLLVKIKEADIVIASFNEIDIKSHLYLPNLIDCNEYTLIVDDSENFDIIFTHLYSMNIDLKTIVNATSQILYLKEQFANLLDSSKKNEV